MMALPLHYLIYNIRIGPAFIRPHTRAFQKDEKIVDMDIVIVYNFLRHITGRARSFYGKSRKHPDMWIGYLYKIREEENAYY